MVLIKTYAVSKSKNICNFKRIFRGCKNHNAAQVQDLLSKSIYMRNGSEQIGMKHYLKCFSAFRIDVLFDGW